MAPPCARGRGRGRAPAQGAGGAHHAGPASLVRGRRRAAPAAGRERGAGLAHGRGAQARDRPAGPPGAAGGAQMSRPPRRPVAPRHTVAVEIAGEKHVLRSDVPPEYTRSVAQHVDATIRALPGFQTLEPFRAATLAALSITDELFRAREEIRRLREDAEYRTNIAADQLEAAVAAAAEQRPVRRP